MPPHRVLSLATGALFRSWFAAVALGMPSLALAVDCSGPYGTDKLLGDLIAVESALRDANNDGAKEGATRMAAIHPARSSAFCLSS